MGRIACAPSMVVEVRPGEEMAGNCSACGGRARRYVALVGNLLVASGLMLALLTFSP
ncbi:MAG: hypothetical protein Q4C90_07160 [Kocuria sp.]|uniref:Uncharacterized protein n=1 Tax=Kocuria varians TaxID=1272 RepID=A0A7D7KZM4_KOCVA|nr:MULTISPECIES: hypothetical protein [Kocuria]MBS6030026.1 hypothetical protein [Kocuria rhizophila]WNB87734.1 hypothetical protein RGB72_06865 [Glutamicibacter protophormiae]MDN5631541.1 hypothetical protein [Kocuria sp.]MDO4256926.1 hypothetical protein [Kocuria sp.]QMS56686.1 hypothetical protein CIB50_0001400 [Kocuria varians]